MTHEPGPLGELAENLTGAAAGRYGTHPGEDLTDIADTQGPTGRTADPLGRRGDGETDDDEPPVVDRPEDADGAPEL